MDNTIIELTPFRADLTRALSRRGERLLAAVDLAEEVAALEPLEAYYIVREIGLDQAMPILLQMNQQQMEACVDLDCWHGYDFGVDRLDEWLAAFAQAGPETLARSFFDLDYVIQLLFLAKTVTVYDPDMDQVPLEDRENVVHRAMTPDGFYLLELKPDIFVKIHPFTVLDALYQYDPSATHRLLSEVRVELPMQIEEEALRFRNGRMQDIGFVGPDEAAVLFSRPLKGKSLPRPQPLTDAGRTRVPAVYARPLSEISLLQQALSLKTEPETLARLEQEIVWAINSAIIAYGDTTRDIQQVTDRAARVRDTISLGLESLIYGDDPDCATDMVVARAADLLDVWSIIDLFRHGFAATLELKEQARKALTTPGFRAWYDLADTEQSDEPADRLERAFVNALLGRHPLYSGFDPADAERLKAFGCRNEIRQAGIRLQRLVARVVADN